MKQISKSCYTKDFAMLKNIAATYIYNPHPTFVMRFIQVYENTFLHSISVTARIRMLEVKCLNSGKLMSQRGGGTLVYGDILLCMGATKRQTYTRKKEFYFI